MITFLEAPFRGTDKETGFEILIHGFVSRTDGVDALCVSEEGVLHTLDIAELRVATDWRYTRERGWFMVNEPEDDD